MINTTSYIPETASAFYQSPELPTGAANTAEGLYSVFVLRDQPADWAFECLDRIERLRELPPNWNSYSAHQVDLNSIEFAKRCLFFLCHITGVGCPRVAASPAGNVALSWEWADHTRELDLEILPDGTLRYSYIDEQDPSQDIEQDVADPYEVARRLTQF